MLFQRTFINLRQLRHTSLHRSPFPLPLLSPFCNIGGNVAPTRCEVHVTPERKLHQLLNAIYIPHPWYLGPVLLKFTSSKTPKGCPRGQDAGHLEPRKEERCVAIGDMSCDVARGRASLVSLHKALGHSSRCRWRDSPRASILSRDSLFLEQKGEERAGPRPPAALLGNWACLLAQDDCFWRQGLVTEHVWHSRLRQ